MDNFKNEKVVIIGLGISGVAAAKLLKEKGAKVIISDIKKESELKEHINLLGDQSGYIFELGEHNEQTLLNADKIVVSPGVPFNIPVLNKAREIGIEVIGEIELAYRFLKGKVIGITGTKGKTTTTTLISEILQRAGRKAKVGGNIGNPLSSMINLNGSNEELIYVIELSSFQLEGIKDFKPHAAAILNVTADHLDRYKNIQEYVEAKSMIFSNQHQKDMLILNANDKFTPIYEKMAKSKIYMFNSINPETEGAFLERGIIKLRINKNEISICRQEDLLIKGVHNTENVMVASLISYLSGVGAGIISDVVKNFKGVEHRQEFVADIEDISFINNSQGTNVDAVKKSLLSYSNPILLIAGGINKGGDFKELCEVVKQKVKKIILIGESKEEIKNALSGCSEIVEADNLEEAVRIAYYSAKANDVILLSPGCASFDMFKNYEERGKVFKEAVLNISREKEQS